MIENIHELRFKKELTAEEMEFLYDEITRRDVVPPGADDVYTEGIVDDLLHTCASFMKDILVCKEIISRCHRQQEKIVSNLNTQIKVKGSDLFINDVDVKKLDTDRQRIELVNYKLRDTIDLLESAKDAEGDLKNLRDIAENRYNHLKSINVQLRNAKTLLSDKKKIDRALTEKGFKVKAMPAPPTLEDITPNPIKGSEIKEDDLEPTVMNRPNTVGTTELNVSDNNSISVVDIDIPDDLFGSLGEEDVVGPKVVEPEMSLDVLPDEPPPVDIKVEEAALELPAFLTAQKISDTSPVLNGNNPDVLEEDYDFDALFSEL